MITNSLSATFLSSTLPERILDDFLGNQLVHVLHVWCCHLGARVARALLSSHSLLESFPSHIGFQQLPDKELRHSDQDFHLNVSNAVRLPVDQAQSAEPNIVLGHKRHTAVEANPRRACHKGVVAEAIVLMSAWDIQHLRANRIEGVSAEDNATRRRIVTETKDQHLP